MKDLLKTIQTSVFQTANSLTLVAIAAALTLAGCEPGTGSTNSPGQQTGQQTGQNAGQNGGETGQVGQTPIENEDPCASGDCYAVVEIMDDLNNPTLAPTCDKGSPYSPGADIDGAVLADEFGTVFATLGNCVQKTQPTSCENSHSDLSAAEGNVTLLEENQLTNYYDPLSRKGNFAPAETKSGDYVALNGASIQCEWVDIDSGKATYATPKDTIWVYEVGGGNGTKTESYNLRVCTELGGSCDQTKGFGSGVSFVKVADLLSPIGQ
ncbi:MAG: hypothetical protein ACI9OJ_004765 [Myxococcota bacterium]|jgi:hypothetical protein